MRFLLILLLPSVAFAVAPTNSYLSIPPGAVNLVTVSSATPATGDIIDGTRLVDWRAIGPGVEGDIPTISTVFTTLTAGATLSQVQTALNNCPGTQAVVLAAGAYSFAGDLDWQSAKDWTVLRGAGTNTVVTWSTGGVIMRPSSLDGTGAPVNTSANLSIDAVKGSNLLTLASVPSWVTVGNLVAVDEFIDGILSTNFGQQSGASFRQDPGTNGARNIDQLMRVTAKTATTITVTPNLFYGFRASKAAQIFEPFIKPDSETPRRYCGIENIQLKSSYYGGQNQYFVFMEVCENCWMRGVEINSVPGAGGVTFFGGFHNTIRHCYIHDSQCYDPGCAYATAFYHFSCCNLIDDTIVQNLVTAPNVEYGSSGNVIAYNFEFQGTNPVGNQWAGMNTHGAHPMWNLWEGCYCTDKNLNDFTHASASHNTVFGCRFAGSNGTGDLRTCISVEWFNFYFNFVGNVMGTPGVHDTYMVSSNQQSRGNGAIFNVGGWENNNNTYIPSVPPNYTNGAFILIHMNYDTVHTDIVYNPLITSRTLTNSYYLDVKPVWWTNDFPDCKWPRPFDPTNGAAIAANALSYTNIPAGRRWSAGKPI